MKHLIPFVSLALAHPNLGAREPSAADPNICHGWDGDDYEDVEGSVMGDVMGDGRMMTTGGMEVVGYDDDGTPIVTGRLAGGGGGVYGAAKRAGGHVVKLRKPNWRKSQLAPGVIAPDQGMLPLPLTGSTGTNTFGAALGVITFLGQLQKPFRGERLLVSTTRTGTSATGRLISQLFVGTDLQQLDVPGFDAEQVGSPVAFGVRLTMKPAQPGVYIRLVTTLDTALAGTDTIQTTITLLGRLVH